MALVSPPPVVALLSHSGISGWWEIQQYWFILAWFGAFAVAPWHFIARYLGSTNERVAFLVLGSLASYRVAGHILSGLPLALAMAAVVLMSLWLMRRPSIRADSHG